MRVNIGGEIKTYPDEYALRLIEQGKARVTRQVIAGDDVQELHEIKPKKRKGKKV